MLTLLNFVLALTGIALIWMFTRIKKIYTQLNKRNNKVPDVEILKQIIPPSSSIGWRIVTVSNGVPLWSYKGSFTFAPNNIIVGRALLHHKSEKVLQELVNINTFSGLFPEVPSLKVESSNNVSNQDIVSLSNVNTSLSLTSIVSCHLSHVNFTLERCWFKGARMSWLYMCPTSVLLAQQYGYWMSFMMQDLDDGNGCILYALASFPSSVPSSQVHHMISSCLVLAREHIDSKYIYEQTNTPIKTGVIRRVSQTPSPNPGRGLNSPSRNSPVLIKPTPKKISTYKKEAFGFEEAPAEIHRISSDENLKTRPKTEEPIKTSEEISQNIPLQTEQNDDKTQSRTVLPLNGKENEKGKKDQNDVDKTKSTTAVPSHEDAGKRDTYPPEVVEKLNIYQDKLRSGYDMLLQVYQATEANPGWSNLGVRDGVQIYKKDADELSASLCYKGSSEVHVPLNYLLDYLLNIEYKKDYDSLFEKGIDVELLGDGLTKIINLQYVNIWPTTGRDFCSVSAIRHLKDNLYGIMLRAVTHPRCPENKNKVRGEVIIAGYVIEELSKDPPINRLTYITRGELKGSVPQRIVNRVTAEQPMFAASIRKHCERRYQIDDPPKNNCKDWLSIISVAPSMFEDKNKQVEQTEEVDGDNKDEDVINDTSENLETPSNTESEQDEFLDTENKSEKQTLTSTPVAVKPEGLTASGVEVTTEIGNENEKEEEQQQQESEEDTMLPSGFNIQENYYAEVKSELELPKQPRRLTNEDSLLDDSESIGDLSQVEVYVTFHRKKVLSKDVTVKFQFTEDLNTTSTTLSVSDQVLELPRDERGQIDFITLGNQTAAGLEREFFITRDFLQSATLMTTQADTTDCWSYLGTTKDVVIMRKAHPDQKFHSFLGSSIINVLPVTVWEAIRNPTTRFVYDNMLKRTSVVKEITERHRIIHMRHETHACFVKQARDFCVLTVERVEQQRYVLAAVSVDIPECPPVRDCVRGTVLSSGWIIEPIIKDGKSCSKVTYISQINFGGRLPTRLINFISKRQPMALAYLRDYLESAEI